MTTVILALDKFKGSLSAQDTVLALEQGILEAFAECHVIKCPIADGGEGTVEAAISAGYGQLKVTVEGPLGGPVRAHCAILGDHAVVELAECCGLQYIQPTAANHQRSSTYGLGQAIRTVISHGARRVLVGLGGSASTDGGSGMLQALGARLTDEQGQPLERGVGHLENLVAVDLSAVEAVLEGVELIALSDVENPLLGVDGAAATFGSQKGLPHSQVPILDIALGHFAAQLNSSTGQDHTNIPGSGAAGGTGFGLLSIGAELRSGAEEILALLGLETHLRNADVVVLGEGSLDAQTLQGKGPAVVARWASAQPDLDVIAVAGRVQLTGEQLREAGIDLAYDLTKRAGSAKRSMRDTAQLLRTVGHDIGHRIANSAS